MALLQRARDSGICPPSLITENRVETADGFEAAVTKIMNVNGMLAEKSWLLVAAGLDLFLRTFLRRSGTGRFCLLVGSKKFVGLQLADFCLSSFCFLAGLALSDGEVVEDFQKVMQVSKELR